MEPVQRREQRKAVDWISMIRFADGTDHPCTVRDVSASGLKISVREDLALPETFMVRVIGIKMVFRVRQAWRRKHDVGVLIEKIAKLPDPPAAPAEPTPAQAPEHHARLGSRRRFETSP